MKTRAFTLIELLVVIAIIAVLMAITTSSSISVKAPFFIVTCPIRPRTSQEIQRRVLIMGLAWVPPGHIIDVFNLVGWMVHIESEGRWLKHGLMTPVNEAPVIPSVHFRMPVGKTDCAPLVVPHRQWVHPACREIHDPGTCVVSSGINVLQEYILGGWSLYIGIFRGPNRT